MADIFLDMLEAIKNYPHTMMMEVTNLWLTLF